MLWVNAALLTICAVMQSTYSLPRPPRMTGNSENEVPIVPPALGSVITGATRERLAIRSLDGRSIPVDISGWNIWEFSLDQDGRYLGISVSGYEVVGHIIVDRAARANNVIETGRRPVFSGDGRWFAVAGITDADQGNFEGIGLWEVGPASSTRRFFTDAVPLSSDWRIDGWINSCVAISAITSEGRGYYSSGVPEKRHNYGLWVEPSITLQQTGPDKPCGASKRP